ncbi:MAG: hypothetical protein IKH39_00095 [Candidatus Methanomethylophilaceae archaeon]|nr:hypothetical protein [Candidatus Methanomethylophilaceae archaeon]
MKWFRTASLSASLTGKNRTNIVKIITSIRRSGMAVLMKQCIGLLEGSDVPDSNDGLRHVNLLDRLLGKR